MAERFAVVSRISVLAELAVASRCVVPALQTNTSADSTRLLIHGHTEPTLSRVTITFTCWEREKQTKMSADRKIAVKGVKNILISVKKWNFLIKKNSS